MRLFSRLMPREVRFFDLFNRHAELVVKGGAALATLLRSYDDVPGRAARIEEIGEIEHTADRVTRAAISTLLRDDGDVRPVIELQAVYELLGAALDRCQDVADVIEGVVLENG